METGSNLYYEGNTVVPPSPGMKRRWRAYKQTDVWDFQEKVMSYEPKICATNNCLWCNQSFDGRYAIICKRCRNCQYCGLRSSTGMDVCRLCGNKLPDDLRAVLTTFKPEPVE